MPPSDSFTPKIDVQPASLAEQSVLANLFELYSHDFSEFYDVDINEDGRFGYQSLPLYWSEPGRHPFLIRVDSKLAGFALVKRGPGVFDGADVWDMAEFFILRAHRRHGIGARAAHQVWGQFIGAWEVRVMEANRSAVPFWERAVASFVGQPVPSVRIERSGKAWNVFRFSASASSRD